MWIWIVLAALAVGWVFCILPGRGCAAARRMVTGRNFAHRGLHSKDGSVPENSLPAFAAATDPLTVVNNLSTFIFSLIRAIGLILLGWGIVQVGLSFQSHDPSQRSQGFLTLAGGLVITFTKEILDLITGTP